MHLFLAVLITLFSVTCFAQESAPFCAYGSGDANIAISRGEEEHVSLGLAAWGPNWAWTGIEGSLTNQQGVAVAAYTARLGGTGVPIHIRFQGEQLDPKRLQFRYEMHAESDTKLTLVVLGFRPGPAFSGREVIVTAEGKETRVRCPFEKRGLGRQVTAICLPDPKGGQTKVTLDPPCDIASDGAGRIILAQDQLAGNEIRRLILTVDLPGKVAWYPTSAEVPDIAGAQDWYVWRGTGDAKEGLLSLADWMETPAGKSGRITRQGDRLIYGGRPIKLWGLNLCYGTCAPEKQLAERRAGLYRQYGINAVRLHKWADGSDWSGIQSKDSCVQFDPAGLDRMDYQVAKFKEAGIYVKLSATFGSLKLGLADKQYVPFLEEFGTFKNGRIETPHSAIHYSPDLQKVQALQVVNLLKHKNPYTGMTYAEDPAVAFVEIINEQSILFYTSMGPLKASPTLRKQVAERFCAWLTRKYGNQAQLAAAWGPGAFDCFSGDGFKAEGGEHLDRKNILPLGNPWYWDPAQLSGSQAAKRRRLLDSLQFLYELECEFYDGYTREIRSAGYQGELIGSNWQAGRAYSHFANLHADAGVGTVDRHNYFGEERASASMLGHAGSGLLSTGMQQVQDRPFMMSEWIHVYPNEMGVEGPALVAAYGMGLQGWDVSFLFQNGDRGTFSPRLGMDQWDVTVPQILGLFPAVARQVHRGDVSEAKQVAVRNVHVPSLFEGKLGFDEVVAQGYDSKELDSSRVPARALAVVRSVVHFTDTYTETPAFDLKPFQQGDALVSSTSQLQWHETAANHKGGYFTIDSPGTKAVVGFSAGTLQTLGDLTIEPASPFSAIYVTAREKDQDLEHSKQVLVVALARARNTGMKFAPTGDRLLLRGEAPIRLEPVKAKITLRKAGTPKVLLLDHDGRLTGQSLPSDHGIIDVDGARDKTPYYLIQY